MPTASLSWKTRPARIDSMIAGVPASSRWAGSTMYRCSDGFTYDTAPPPTTTGTEFVSNRRSTTSTPGVPGPPTNLCGERKTASLSAISIRRYGPAVA